MTVFDQTDLEYLFRAHVFATSKIGASIYVLNVCFSSNFWKARGAPLGHFLQPSTNRKKYLSAEAIIHQSCRSLSPHRTKRRQANTTMQTFVKTASSAAISSMLNAFSLSRVMSPEMCGNIDTVTFTSTAWCPLVAFPSDAINTRLRNFSLYLNTFLKKH